MVFTEWLSPHPKQGMSIWTPDYYYHIYVSCRRILYAFTLATVIGVPLGIMMGWSKKFCDYAFPLLEVIRPIPILAWVPLAILMFSGYESPVIFLATLASLFVTMINTMLGVQSIDSNYFRAAGCLGSSKTDILRHVVIPGALPFVFTGLQISIGVAWFSLVAAEMVSGDLRARLSDPQFLCQQRDRPDGDRNDDARTGWLAQFDHRPPCRQSSDAVERARAEATRALRGI